jgi:hypothetical protein
MFDDTHENPTNLSTDSSDASPAIDGLKVLLEIERMLMEVLTPDERALLPSSGTKLTDEQWLEVIRIILNP